MNSMSIDDSVGMDRLETYQFERFRAVQYIDLRQLIVHVDKFF
jgi:hypothetical protein